MTTATMIWIFSFCVLEGVECDMQAEVMPNYDACVSAQEQYAEEHQDEDYLSVCRPRVDVRA